MNSSDLTIAIVGATGAVGRVALDLLAERGHSAEKIVAMASSRSAGKKLPYKGEELTVIEGEGVKQSQRQVILGQTLTMTHDSINRDSFMPGVLLAVKRVITQDGLVVGLDRVLGLDKPKP